MFMLFFLVIPIRIFAAGIFPLLLLFLQKILIDIIRTTYSKSKHNASFLL